MLERHLGLSLYAETPSRLVTAPPKDEVEWTALEMLKGVDCSMLIRQAPSLSGTSTATL